MKNIVSFLLTLALAATATAKKVDRSVRPAAGPPPKVQLGKPASFTLPNGLKVFVVENHKFPVVSFSIQFDVKPELEGDMSGFRSMLTELLTSGTQSRSKEKLNEEIDFIGAHIQASDKGLYARSLKKHQEKLLDLLSDVTMRAEFSQEELEKIRNRMLSSLHAERNEPEAMMRNVSSVINFGDKHPYGEVATETSVGKVTLERCREYYNTYFRPNVAYMAIVGDITVDEARALTEKHFGGWKKADVPVASYPKPGLPESNRVIVVHRDGAVQSLIQVTYPLPLTPGHPDLIKSSVASTILGGGSQGRLFLNLREQHGWTYGAYSSIESDELMGSFTAFTQCRNEVTDSAVTEILAEMSRMQQELVPDTTFRNTLAYLSGGFAIGLSSPSRVAQYAINVERYNMPSDYYANYLKNLSAVTPEEVRSIAGKYFRPAGANIIIVGNKYEIADKLKKFTADGNIEYYNYYGVAVEDEGQIALPEGITAADVLQKYGEAIGGKKTLESIRDIRTESEGSIQGVTISLTELKKASGLYKAEVSQMGMVLQKKVLNKQEGYQEAAGRREVLSAEDLNDARETADLLAPFHPSKYGVDRKLVGIESDGGKKAYVLEIAQENEGRIREYYDMVTGLLIKKISTVQTPQGLMSVPVVYDDYQVVPGTSGYRVPYTVSVQIAPGMNMVTRIKKVEVNTGIPDQEFK